MYCPSCGKKLIKNEMPEAPEIDWMEQDSDKLNKQIEASQKVEDIEREEYSCEGGCFQKDFPLYYHHPFGGIDSRPGDSWSLSWVK